MTADKDGNPIALVAHLGTSSAINSRPGGADELWRQIQGNELLPDDRKTIHLRRNPAVRAGCKEHLVSPEHYFANILTASSAILTRHFAQNYVSISW